MSLGVCWLGEELLWHTGLVVGSGSHPGWCWPQRWRSRWTRNWFVSTWHNVAYMYVIVCVFMHMYIYVYIHIIFIYIYIYTWYYIYRYTSRGVSVQVFFGLVATYAQLLGIVARHTMGELKCVNKHASVAFQPLQNSQDVGSTWKLKLIENDWVCKMYGWDVPQSFSARKFLSSGCVPFLTSTHRFGCNDRIQTHNSSRWWVLQLHTWSMLCYPGLCV